MNFLPTDIMDYAERHTQAEPELLEKIKRETHLEVLQPRMLSGPFQGRFLSLISHLVNPSRILEIGTYTGYSALCLAEGLKEDGKLVTIDVNEELERRVKGYFDASPWKDKIDYRIGDAVDVIPTLNEPWDLVFIDADKKNYLRYFQLVVDQVRSGGFILADNVLWSGKVVDQTAMDRETEVLRDYNAYVHTDVRVENLLLPIRDGIMVARKK
jgi:predicted O-methyltransferase YrrM